MNTALLQPALQRIINAVDSLPGRKGQHVPKALLDAVHAARLAIAHRPLPPLSEDRMANYMRNRILELREEYGLSPSKQRITLRGGPLDGCWYLVDAYYGDHRDFYGHCFTLIVEDGTELFLRYSLPDSHGICDYRE